MKKDSQTSMYEHSEAKVSLLKTYLERYFNVLNNSKLIGDIYYFDLFCAEGIYLNGGKGSPILVLESIKNAFYGTQKKRGFSNKFHCLFNDVDLNKLTQLEANIKKLHLHHPHQGTLNFENKEYKIIHREVNSKLAAIGTNEKAFVFIDPYGYKDIRISDIRSLLENKKTEVLLFLPTHFMFRFSENSTPESLYKFIEEIVPNRDWPQSKTGLEFIDNLKLGFKDFLGDEYFVDTFVISRELNQFFCLFFFTSHIYGFDRMLDAKWKLDEEDGRGWKHNVANDLFSGIEKQPNTEIFQNKLSSFLKEKRSNADVYQFTLREGHIPKHTTQILKMWQNSGNLEAKLNNGNEPRKSSFYINHEFYKKEPRKIFFSLRN